MSHMSKFDILQQVRRESGAQEGDWLDQAIEAWWNVNGFCEFENVDNVRLAPKDDAELVQTYEAFRDGGCCGSVDVELGPSPSGRTYLYGFNHGH